jgi:hypothetical protein
VAWIYGILLVPILLLPAALGRHDDFNQGDILATAVPGFPVFDLAGFIGSSLWAIWLIALGVAVLRGPIRRLDPGVATPGTRSPATPRADRP